MDTVEYSTKEQLSYLIQSAQHTPYDGACFDFFGNRSFQSITDPLRPRQSSFVMKRHLHPLDARYLKSTVKLNEQGTYKSVITSCPSFKRH